MYQIKNLKDNAKDMSMEDRKKNAENMIRIIAGLTDEDL